MSITELKRVKRELGKLLPVVQDQRKRCVSVYQRRKTAEVLASEPLPAQHGKVSRFQFQQPDRQSYCGNINGFRNEACEGAATARTPAVDISLTTTAAGTNKSAIISSLLACLNRVEDAKNAGPDFLPVYEEDDDDHTAAASPQTGGFAELRTHMSRLFDAFGKNVDPQVTFELSEDDLSDGTIRDDMIFSSARSSLSDLPQHGESKKLSVPPSHRKSRLISTGLVGHIDCIGRFVIGLSDCYCEDKEMMRNAMKRWRKITSGYNAAIST